MEMKRYQKEENFSPEKIAKLREHYKAILELLGEDPAREGLLKTPERVAKAMSFLTQGYEDDPLSIIRSATFKEEYRQMVLVKDIELYSLCEHHMLPFYGKAHVAYSTFPSLALCALPQRTLALMFSDSLWAMEP